MKILHISFHKGCINDINYVLNKLNYEYETMFFFNELEPNARGGPHFPYYVLNTNEANRRWEQHKEYFNTFDCIITSDTGPLSRIFLQNNWNKKLIIWICNRFDYAVEGDNDYYNLIREAYNKPNVIIIPNTNFEILYCSSLNIKINNNVIKPICLTYEIDYNIEKTIIDNKKDTFFIPSYHNETKFMNLSKLLTNIGIKNYNKRHTGLADLMEFKGVICIPYAYSTWALLENLSLQILTFIPSKTFIQELSKQLNFWHQNKNFLYSHIEISEWYNKEHKDLLIYFDSWEDLKIKINTLNYEKHKLKLKKFGKFHEEEILKKWSEILKI